MADHNPLCLLLDDSLPPICVCGVIARVRADERERVARAIEALPVPGFLDAALLLHDSWRRWRDKVAMIARNGGSDE